MTLGELRFAFFARDYEKTMAYYRDDLEVPIIESWNLGLMTKGLCSELHPGV